MRIALDRLSKRFGATCVLRDLSLDIPSGQRVALVGPNGSGKSTLLRAVLGFITAEGGQAGPPVLVGGLRPIEDRARLSGRIAYVPQVAPQLAAPVAEVIDTVAGLRGIDPALVGEAARALDLHVGELARRPFRALSGGMKQKLLIALGLAAGAELLVMDEPTASLDGAARARFFRLFAERARSVTLLLCSHRLEEVRHLVERVVTLADGRIAADVPLDAFLDERDDAGSEVWEGLDA